MIINPNSQITFYNKYFFIILYSYDTLNYHLRLVKVEIS